MTYNPLIFGKDPTERIVSIEVDDNIATVFMEDISGEIITKEIPNKFWLLSNEQHGKNWVRLKGDQYYKYGRQFTKFSEYASSRARLGDKVYGIWDKVEALCVKDGLTYFKGMKFKEVSILSFDIETVGTEMDIDSKVLLIANTYRNTQGEITRKQFAYDEYETQGDMITAWCSWVREMNPSIICGHNIYGFDIPYLDTVAGLNNVKLKLGRDESEIFISNRESRFRKDGSQTIGYKKIRCYGRSLIDTMFLSIKYDVGRKYENYRLKDIIKHEGLEKKDRTFYDASKIRHNYKNPEEWEKIKKYAEEDGDDALALYDLMGASMFYFTSSVPKSYQLMIESATGSQINSMMVRSYLQNAHSVAKASEITHSIQGGISFAVPNVYKNLLKIDLKSAYPSQILRFKLYDKEKDPEQNFYKLVHYFTYERFDLKDMYKKTKNVYYKDREQTSKLFINSAYGCLTTSGLNYNCVWMGAKITEETRNVIDLALTWASGKGKDYWINRFKEAVDE